MAAVFVIECGGLGGAGLDWVGVGEMLLVEVADAAMELELEGDEVVDVDCETLAAEPAWILKLPKPPDVEVLKSVMPQHPLRGAWPSWAPQQK